MTLRMRRGDAIDLADGVTPIVKMLTNHLKTMFNIPETKYTFTFTETPTSFESVTLPDNYYTKNNDLRTIDIDIKPNTKSKIKVRNTTLNVESDVSFRYRRIDAIELMKRLAPTWQDFIDGKGTTWQQAVLTNDADKVKARLVEIMKLTNFDTRLTVTKQIDTGSKPKYEIRFNGSKSVLMTDVFYLYPSAEVMYRAS